MDRFTGGCLCGKVRWELSEPPESAGYCHCTRCQRRTGTAASANGLAEPGSFHILSGEDRVRAWKPEGGWEKWFCGDCGSSIYGNNPAHPDAVSIRMGTFDDDPGVRPRARQFVAFAAPIGPDRPDQRTLELSVARDAGICLVGCSLLALLVALLVAADRRDVPGQAGSHHES